MLEKWFRRQAPTNSGQWDSSRKLAASKLWRLTEELATREGSITDVLNRYARAQRRFLPYASDVPADCRALLSFIEAKFKSKQRYVDEWEDGYWVPKLVYDPFEIEEAREVAKAIIDLTFSMTIPMVMVE